ncbi:hypothetical protein [Methylobacterium sp. Leaf112]|uniref:hypothetical protein n=1 Tax=Methylobacterium sp. Leaf112 TaxID=1736258 RepID=UPI0006FDF518|nr:hypothetical protein [Methylobacterium sp. Leaf112]KQP72371.1 hypothetical protein ASF52_02310 [Methylobacterium sp. Leaf112]
MTEQPKAPGRAHLLSLPSADDLDVARILGLPALPAGDPSIDEAYRDLSAKGQVLYVRGVAVAADNLVPNAPVDIPGWAREHLRLPAAQSQRSGPLVMSPL